MAAAIRGPNRPQMCGRYRQFRRYEQFVVAAAHPTTPRLLAFEQAADDKPLVTDTGGKLNYQIGKTRLLGEIEWLSVLDGFVPARCSLSEGRRIAANLLHLAVLLAEAMDTARKSFGLTEDVTSNAHRLAFKQCGREATVLTTPRIRERSRTRSAK